MDFVTLQKIMRGVIESSSACDGQLFTGKVISDNPLQIKLGEEADGIVLDGDDIILTESVVSKKLYIKKHTHGMDDALVDYQATGNLGAPIIFAPLGVEIWVPSGNEPPYTDDDPNPKGSGTNPQWMINPAIPNPQTLPLKHSHAIHTSTLDAWVTEYGTRLPRDPNDYDAGGEQICITINRSLAKDDSVIMTRVSHGQQFIVLSRYFEVDSPGEDDE